MTILCAVPQTAKTKRTPPAHLHDRQQRPRNPPIHTWLENAEPAKKQPSGTEQGCPRIAPKRTAHAAFAPDPAKASPARISVAVNLLYAAILHQSVWPAALGATATQVAVRPQVGIVAVRILYIRRKQAIENL